ncbi:MAG: hypothetical protein ABSB19_19745 [Methylomonas sp.]
MTNQNSALGGTQCQWGKTTVFLHISACEKIKNFVDDFSIIIYG